MNVNYWYNNKRWIIIMIVVVFNIWKFYISFYLSYIGIIWDIIVYKCEVNLKCNIM